MRRGGGKLLEKSFSPPEIIFTVFLQAGRAIMMLQKGMQQKIGNVS